MRKLMLCCTVVKSTETYMKRVKYIKICFKIKEVLDFSVPRHLQPICSSFRYTIRKIIKKIHYNSFIIHLYLFFYCYYEILKSSHLLPKGQSFFHRTHENSLTWFLLVIRIKGKDANITPY